MEGGHVVLEGANGLAVTLTADAALLTGRRLIAAGQEAQRRSGNNG